MAVFQDLSGRAAGKRSLRARGGSVLAVLAVLGGLFYLDGEGAFSEKFKISLETTTVGEGLAEGADVKYRGLRIGEVESIDTQSFNHQIIRLSLDPKKASALRGITSAKYQSSNIFGAPAIELLSGNDDKALKEGDLVTIDSKCKAATITSLLRQAAALTGLFGTQKVQHLLRLYSGDTVGPLLHTTLDLLKIYLDNVGRPIDIERDALPLIDGFGLVIGPLVQVLEDIYDHSGFLGDPVSRAATVEALQSSQELTEGALGNMLDNLSQYGTDSLGFLIDIGHPLFMSGASAASAWGNLETFINRVEDAMPSVDGEVKLRLEVLLPASRALPQDDSDERDSPPKAGQRQLTPEQQQQVQRLQTQLLGAAPQTRRQQAQQGEQPQQGQQPEQQAQQQSKGDAFASIPTTQSEGGIR